MQLIRTLSWILATIILVSFIAMNSALMGSESVSVRFWPLENGNWVELHWPVGFIVLASIAVGFLPMWLLHKGARWRLKRRIGFLENTVRSASQGDPAPIATSTQLESREEPPASPS